MHQTQDVGVTNTRSGPIQNPPTAFLIGGHAKVTRRASAVLIYTHLRIISPVHLGNLTPEAVRDCLTSHGAGKLVREVNVRHAQIRWEGAGARSVHVARAIHLQQ